MKWTSRPGNSTIYGYLSESPPIDLCSMGLVTPCALALPILDRYRSYKVIFRYSASRSFSGFFSSFAEHFRNYRRVEIDRKSTNVLFEWTLERFLFDILILEPPFGRRNMRVAVTILTSIPFFA